MAIVTRERWRILEPLLDHALELSIEDRATWLDELRLTSADLATDIEKLLADETAADRAGFLADRFEMPAHVTSPQGMQLSGYTLERAIGEGGAGWVWLAHRTDGRFEGKAAVKLLNIGLLTPRGQERFRREGSTLARLAHVNIARLLDAGVTPAGQPYLVLEHVEGQRIDEYVRERSLTVPQIVDLVLQILAAVSHAHANLVVHRDIKPSNILVTHDGVIKLLDFGIAKLLTPDTVGTNDLTVEGGRVLTPEYAAPEQIRGDVVTTATDVYAAGLLLFTLLARRMPYTIADRSLPALERAICDTEPSKPSVVAAESDLRLARQLRGDLDAITLKALRKEPERRYASAAAFAEDLKRYRSGMPVYAQPDHLLYRVRKFVRRHRAGVAVAAAIPLFLGGAAARERELRSRAETETRKVREVERYLLSVFDVADPFAVTPTSGSEVTARALLDRGVTRIDSALAQQPEVQAELRSALGRVYTNLALYNEATPLLEKSLQQRRALYGDRHPLVAEDLDRLGVVLTHRGQYQEADRVLREALAQRRARRGNDTATAHTLNNLATLLQEQDKYAEAEPLFREALAIHERIFGPEHPAVANSLNNLGVLFFEQGKYEEAAALYRRSLDVKVKVLGENHLLTLQAMHNLAQTHHMRGDMREAEQMYRRALAAKRKTLGSVHPSVTIHLNNLASLIAREFNMVEEAEAMAREALATDRKLFGESHAFVAASLNTLGTVLRSKGDFDGAEASFREALAMNRKLFGENHNGVALALANLGAVAFARGDFARAAQFQKQSLDHYEALVGTAHANHITVSLNLARTQRELGNLAEAARTFRSVIERSDTTSKAMIANRVASETGLALIAIDRRDYAEAATRLGWALPTIIEGFGPADLRTAEPRYAMAMLHLARGEKSQAVPLLREAEKTLAPYPVQAILLRRIRAALAAATAPGPSR